MVIRDRQDFKKLKNKDAFRKIIRKSSFRKFTGSFRKIYYMKNENLLYEQTNN